jgi:hypothetical protein
LREERSAHHADGEDDKYGSVHLAFSCEAAPAFARLEVRGHFSRCNISLGGIRFSRL